MHFLSTIASQNFQESIRLQNETMWNVILPKVPTMQYGRVWHRLVSYIRAAVVLWLQEIDGRLKSESAVYPYGLSRQTRSSVGTGLGSDQLR